MITDTDGTRRADASAPDRRRGRIYFGWWVVIASTAMMTLGSGFTFLSFTFYITPMEKTFGWSRTETSVAAVVNALLYAAGAPLAGWWVDRRGVRSAMIGGLLATVAAFVLLRYTTALWQFYVYWGVIAFARPWMTFTAAGLLVTRWFRRRRGLAINIVSSGQMLGSIFALPLVARLIDGLGWEGSYLVTAFILPVSFVPLLLLVRDRPQDMGLLPDGDAEPDEAPVLKRDDSGRDFTFREGLRSGAYWMTNLAYIFFWMGTDSFRPHQAPFFESRGLDREDIALILLLASMVALVGRVGLAFFIDRIGRLRLLAASSSAFFAFSMLAVVASTGFAGLLGFVVFFGIGQAAGPSIRPLLLARYFGIKALGALMGLTELMNFGGIFLGPILGGVIFDRTGSYSPALLFYSASIGVSLVFFVLARPPRRPSLASEALAAGEPGPAEIATRP